jgi:hypothetical protein
MATTINLGLLKLEANQFNPETTYNQNLEVLDITAQLCASSITNTPPASSDGTIVIVGTSPTGAFVGYANKIAYYYSGWKFITPIVGWIASISSTLSLVVWNGTSWATPSVSQNINELSFYIYKNGDTSAKLFFDLSKLPTSTESNIIVSGDTILAKQNFTASSDPTTSDDNYDVSSIWVNNSTNKIFICVTNTPGNAVWKEMAGATGSGDVLGPVSSVDNELVRFNGITGENIQGSGIIVTDNKQIYSNYAYIVTKVANYTLQPEDSNKIIIVNSSGTVTITLPQTSNVTISEGFSCLVIRRGIGNVLFAIEGSDILESRNSGVSIGNVHSSATVLKIVSGSPNTWGLYGDIL